MKLHPDQQTALNTVTQYDAGHIAINQVSYAQSLLFMPQGAVTPWSVKHFSELTTEHFAALLDYQPELVILGTGSKLQFAHPRLTAPLTSRRIGVECMDLHAACRTYNILMSEGRQVLAALILETT